jgi:hypothetical protein
MINRNPTVDKMFTEYFDVPERRKTGNVPYSVTVWCTRRPARVDLDHKYVWYMSP